MATVKEISEGLLLRRDCHRRAEARLRLPSPIKWTVRHDVTVTGDTYETLYNRAVSALTEAYMDLETMRQANGNR